MNVDFWYITNLKMEAQAGNPLIQLEVLAQHRKDGKLMPNQEARTYAIPLAQAQSIAGGLLEGIRRAQNSTPESSGRLN